MTSPENSQRALSREWMAAKIVAIGGLIIAVAVAGYFAWRAHEQSLPAQSLPHATAKPSTRQIAQAEVLICSAELLRAQAVGAVPTYGVLATGQLFRANGAPHRFVCEMKTHLTHYFVAADLLCNQLGDARCVSVYRVVLKNGKLVYSRPE